MPNTPRILFVGAVTFEEASGSHAYFYRLFREYPADRLMIVASHKFRSRDFPAHRLPGVQYRILGQYARGRRYPLLFQLTLHLELLAAQATARSAARRHRPDMVITLAMDYHWFIAHKVARALKVPLVLVMHDRWEHNTDPPLRKQLLPRFPQVFAQAAHRFCISPTMARLYRERFGVDSDVLYPISGVNEGPGAVGPPAARLRHVVFFGNVWHYFPSFGQLARVLLEHDAKLVLFCNLSPSFFHDHGLTESNVVFKGFVEDHAQILAWCRAHADVLFLPMSFAQAHADEVLYSFPSKLADYTGLGLPLLVHAPARSSLVEFLRGNAGLECAEVACDESPDALTNAVRRLTDAGYRGELGRNSRRVWERFFSPESVRASLFEKICCTRTDNS